MRRRAYGWWERSFGRAMHRARRKRGLPLHVSPFRWAVPARRHRHFGRQRDAFEVVMHSYYDLGYFERQGPHLPMPVPGFPGLMSVSEGTL